MSAENAYSFQMLETATETLRALAHPHRILIVQMLHRNQAMNVTEIYEALQVEQAVTSHQLRILKDKGIVTVRRDGKNSNYMLTDKIYYQVVETLMSVI
ncbi:MAG: hypothetical protein RIR11_4158 [Bacteroidota bacterium]|jgi:ArsR family transcriptional regulator